ncbi:unnamed protein product [Lepeophtheirus salmonis]|uniref:(salmon louse) hypothetical protein n=1 Tax=Lepeophtheirus salmonis TaxID=72036 RepID=A0A7R8H2L8_LEPSM|nr:unnamed protein product [Lepeophtheirus salmonis]CAF2826466.1 unnamed protein product [Lepeophtheirus salmonis]
MDKAQTIVDFPRPSSLRKLRQFIGMITYNHRFLKSCATVLDRLYQIMEGKQLKGVSLTWSTDTDSPFASAKVASAESTLLVHPCHTAPMSHIMEDTSDITVGTVLQ